VYVHLVNSFMYRQITGREAPPTPIDAATYSPHGYPWFDLYGEHLSDLDGSEILQDVKSVKVMDAHKGFLPQQDDDPVDVQQVVTHTLPGGQQGKDGSW
jgi:hypothetical protein